MSIPALVQDVEFIEFAVHKTHQAAFEAILGAMGFCISGMHRSKYVSLWRRGNIRIVVNSEKQGFADSYEITHGTSVCAIALRVSDARSTIARAFALLDVPYEGAVGPGEVDIPAVRGLGGSLVYFVDNASALGRWAGVDFVKVPDCGADAGRLAVDHISQTMQYEETLTWLLFYASLLGAQKMPSQAVLDPGGVVQSRVIESGIAAGHQSLRLVVNGLQSDRTLSARFVTDFFDSGVQHIALTNANILSTVTRMLATGVTMLPISDNYYDDLEARTDLSSEDIAALKSLNILPDRDQGGAFYQACTTTLDGGFFFEIMQRDGYMGYGAPNASVRLAAQARLARPAAMPAR
jgi:4-hydroxyphenylpyruvate dioxygenase